MAGDTTASERRIAAVRKERGISQKALAERVGLTQEHLACIEAGVASCPWAAAHRITSALETDLHGLFPAAVKVMGKDRYPELSDDKLSAIDKAGLDADPREWCVQLTLSSGLEVQIDLGSRDMRRLFVAIQRLDEERFFVFDSNATRVLLNLDHVWCCRLLYDVAVPARVKSLEPRELRLEPEQSEDDDDWVAEVAFSVAHVPLLRISLDHDTPSRDDVAQTADVFMRAETEGDSRPFVARLTDVDGEDAFIRMDDVAVFTAPLVAINPDIDVEFEED